MKNLFGENTAPPSEIVDSFTLSAGAPTESKSRSATPFDVFSLTNAVGGRNKREAWVLYQKALASGMAADEIFFRVFWQVKTMLLASRTKSAEEADLKPFPYSKAKSFLKNFTTSELQNLSENLVIGYHQARRGEEEMETLVEKILLGL